MEARFRAFLEGLEMENIEELMRKTPVELKLVGSVMANRIKSLKLSALRQGDQVYDEKCPKCVNGKLDRIILRCPWCGYERR